MLSCFFFLSLLLSIWRTCARFISTYETEKKIISQLDWPHARFFVCEIDWTLENIDCWLANNKIDHCHQKHTLNLKHLTSVSLSQYKHKIHIQINWTLTKRMIRLMMKQSDLYKIYLSLSHTLNSTDTISTLFATIYKFKLNALKCNNHSIMLIPRIEYRG